MTVTSKYLKMLKNVPKVDIPLNDAVNFVSSRSTPEELPT
jgi:hypothetical protein